MSGNLSQISREIILRGAFPLCEREQFGVQSGSVGNTRLLSRDKMLLVPMNIFSYG